MISSLCKLVLGYHALGDRIIKEYRVCAGETRARFSLWITIPVHSNGTNNNNNKPVLSRRCFIPMAMNSERGWCHPTRIG